MQNIILKRKYILSNVGISQNAGEFRKISSILGMNVENDRN